jgi:hypothetical protein
MPISASTAAAGSSDRANWQRTSANWQESAADPAGCLESAKFPVTIAREVAGEVTIAPVPTAPQRVAQSGPDPGAPAERGDLSVTLEECRRDSTLFISPLVAAAGAGGVDQRDLRVRTLLHLPRVARPSGQVTTRQIERELAQAARQLARDAAAASPVVPQQKFPLGELCFTDSVAPATAGKIFGHLHYLRYDRPGSEYYALLDPVQGLPVTICAVVPLEWKRVSAWVRVQFGVPSDRVLDVARVFSCPTAPANAVSYLLARVRASLAREGKADLLTTIVDPNLGFTGASYRAANWQRWIAIQPRPYLYLDRRYVTPRQLRERFGSSNLAELRAAYPSRRFEASRARLSDSLLFGCHVSAASELPPLREFPTRALHR